MAGGHMKYRHLSRSSAHRKALLRNLVTSLVEHDSITTTWHKAKEAQRLAEKLITLGKRNTMASRQGAQAILMTPHSLTGGLTKVFGELRERYANRPGGYTRVLRIESRNNDNDQADTAILEFVDGKKDMRFAMTAKTLVRERAGLTASSPTNSILSSASASASTAGSGNKQVKTKIPVDESAGLIRDITARNVLKVTRFRPNGEDALEAEVIRLEKLESDRKQKLDLSAGKADAEYDLDLEEKKIWTAPRLGYERFDQFDERLRSLRKVAHKTDRIREQYAERRRLRK